MAKRYDVELEKKIIEEYENGMTPYQMVKLIPELKGKRPSVIYGILKRLNVQVRNPIVITDEQKLNRRKYSVNDNYFNVIDTEEKAYWLGFIYADGYVITGMDKIGISLNSIDKNHLDKFKQATLATYPINDYKEKSGYGVGSIYSRILITSKQMKNDLLRLGIYENKTLILKFPTQVPKCLIRHFIRGYFDGDGSLTYGRKQVCGNCNYSIKFTGTIEMINAIQEYLGTSVKEEQRYPERNVNNYSITIGGNQQVRKILDNLYQGATIYLERKYNRYIELKQLTSS